MRKAVQDVLDSGILTEGPITEQFEKDVAKYVGVKYAVACCNCTAGLELAILALGLKPGDEIIVPDFTYPATASAVLVGGGRAVIADVDKETMQITPELASKVLSSRTRGVMPVPTFGNPLDYDAWHKWSSETGIPIIEDAAPALGTSWKGRKTGSFSLMTVFSFHPRKNLTTGEGGMVVTNDEGLAMKIRSLKRFGIHHGSNGISFEEIGSNRKLSDILSALGKEQMKILDNIIEERKRLAERYMDILHDIEGIRFPHYSSGNCWQTFCIFVPERDAILSFFRQRGIEAQIGTYALHLERAFTNHPDVVLRGDYKNSRYLREHALALPLYFGMTQSEQDKVIEALQLRIIGG